ncbi:von Willebrand factor type A domain-containing protein [Chitinophaga pollutisoli]|uniref:von Willebrand factor type A domain-containing protein n=1 Tax=Chitinophaga pollutisoli TaxID=3133966 RepID=A0ABZ2YVK5_9BACT
MKRILLLCACILACGQLIAQTVRITGKVLDINTKDPIQGATVRIDGTHFGSLTDSTGKFICKVAKGNFTLEVSWIGYNKLVKSFSMNDTAVLIELTPSVQALQEVAVVAYAPQKRENLTASNVMIRGVATAPVAEMRSDYIGTPVSRDEFAAIKENRYRFVQQQPLSTFSSDVDKASFSLVRNMLNMGNIPGKDAVRVEELINYFEYDYPQPAGDAPVAIQADMAQCPWNPAHQLVRIGIQGKTIPIDNLPASNLVFLIDVSGSMSGANRLPLVKQAFRLLVKQLRPQDRVSIVVYAGAAGLSLPSTPGNNKDAILGAIDRLEAGGSTAGGAGIQLAYATAKEHFIKGGNNRVILATDGDFNVGISDVGELERLIEKEREGNVYLSVLGFGMGNYKDNRLETLADKGNGHYAYIDNFDEARRTFTTEFGGTLFTIAKDVKLQVEFNPAKVQAYRLVGYENRLLENEDFNDDKKDAGEMGSGHSVTALYELVPPGVKLEGPNVDPLKYQATEAPVIRSDEVLTVKVRYKHPEGGASKLLAHSLKGGPRTVGESPESFRLAVAAAQFGMLLRKSEYAGKSSYAGALALLGGLKGADAEGYRGQLVKMIKQAMALEDIARKD